MNHILRAMLVLLAHVTLVSTQQDDYAALDLLNPKKKRDLVHMHL